MEWTNHLGRLADLRKEGHSVQKCAEEFNVRYGTMATVFSRYGIVSEEQKQLDKDRWLARKFALWGWSVEDIADQLDRCHAFVRKAIKASAPAMTSAIGKQAVDRATKYLNDLSPGVIRDLKQD